MISSRCVVFIARADPQGVLAIGGDAAFFVLHRAIRSLLCLTVLFCPRARAPANRYRHGRLAPPERPRDVPRAVEALLRRGLSVEPHRRFASMRDLMVALEDASEIPARARKWAWVAAAVGILVGALWLISRTPCPEPRRAFADVWSPSSKRAIGEAFRSTNLSYAKDAWDRVMPRLELFVSSWRRTHVELCRATRVRGEQNEHLYSLQQICLQRKKDRFYSVIRQLRATTPNVVDRTAELVTGLSVAGCRDPAALLAAPPPATSTSAASVARIREALLHLDVQYGAGAYGYEVGP